MERYSAAEAFIDVLNANGVEHIFFNPGGEQAPIQAAIAQYRAQGKKAPQLVLCLHESVALTAAHGYYMVTGKPGLVMVHSELGTQQMGGAILNAQWGRIPVILWAGLMPSGQRVNWKQEPFDQGLMLRNNVKWDHTIAPNENLADVLQKGFETALAEPRGPVYLVYPRDVLAIKAPRVAVSPAAGAKAPAPDIAKLGEVAEVLLKAERPLIVAGYTGRYQQSVASLVELAETLCAPVLTSQVYLNFPTDHPLSVGVEQILGSVGANSSIADAAAILDLDYDMPYALADGLPGPSARVMEIGVDATTQGRALWGRGADLFMKADSREAIPALNGILHERLTPEKQAQFRQRFERLKASHERQRAEWRSQGDKAATEKPVSPDWLCRCIEEVMGQDDLLFNFTISHSASVTDQIERTHPGTMFGCPCGSIQWSMAAALGAKVAAPDRTVVSIVTDGGFVWGCPVSTLWTARSYKAPFLTVVLNNQSYGFIHQHVERAAGVKRFSDKEAFEAGVDIMPSPDYALVAKSCGAYGRIVDDPTDVMPAVKEAMRQIRRGRAAVLDVRLATP